MAVSNSAINIVLSAVDQYSSELDKFDKKVNKSETGVKRFSKVLKAAGKAAAGMAAALGSAAVAAGVARMRELAETAQTLSAISLVTGETTESLELLGNALKLSGGEFDAAGESIREFNLRMGEAAAKGTGPFIEALDALNLSLEDLIDLEVDQQFRKIAEALEQLPSDEKMFVLDRLFGGDAPQMAKLLAAGVDEFDRLINKSRELGTVMSEELVDSLQTLTESFVELQQIALTAFDGMLTRTLDVIQIGMDGAKGIIRMLTDENPGLALAQTAMEISVRETSRQDRVDKRRADLEKQKEDRRKRMAEKMEQSERESRRIAAAEEFTRQIRSKANARLLSELQGQLDQLSTARVAAETPGTEMGRTAALGSFGAGERFLQTGASLTETWSERMVDNTAAIADINADIKKTQDEIKRLQKEQVRILQTSLPNLVIQGVGA